MLGDRLVMFAVTGRLVVPASTNCEGLTLGLEKFELVVHSKKIVVPEPFGLTAPASVAVVVVTDEALPVVTIGSAVAGGLTVTGTVGLSAEVPVAEFRRWIAYLTVTGAVIGLPSGFRLGATRVTGLTVGLGVDSSVVPAGPRQHAAAVGSVALQ